jgi:hypothetical protein
VPIQSLFPFLYFMVRQYAQNLSINVQRTYYSVSILTCLLFLQSNQIRDLKIAKQEQDIGFYAGFVGEHTIPPIVSDVVIG